MARIVISSKTSNSVTLYLTELDTSWTNGTRTVYWYRGGVNGDMPIEGEYFVAAETCTLADGVYSGAEVTFTGLHSGRTFGILCTIYFGTERLASLTTYVTPGWGWSWKAENAFANNGNTSDVPYTEWNDFVEFVAERTGYYLVSALMDSSDTTLYADKFNAVREAIGGVNTFVNGTNSLKDHYNDTGSWDMSTGEVVKGQYFIDLTEYLNGIP